MFKQIIGVIVNMVKGLIEHYIELWFGEEYEDIPIAFKVIATIIGIIIDIVGISLVIAAIPLMIMMALLIRLTCKGSFEDSNSPV